ncbi:D-TA family PLP-dependent enzyme [Fibrisoma montanum]|uniref:D-TA family PLP-dependent enzyme n=1 Tax=Fibrisoma montanum TaxID=2305895 RepID=A0A418MFD6_9BACT|nr:D-TA family PLP-dependent enzyme [Fibrisoma montanum]RIV25519.1 D-TA family PLP-dependent enzyme [Fibrisoma montanum]
MTNETAWYTLNNSYDLDTPSLVVYKDRVADNIRKMIQIAGNPDRLFVHIKTTKTPEVVQMLLAADITKFKCATIAEAEMVAQAGGKHLIIAHQLVGPKIERLIKLRRQYPDVFMASLLDDADNARQHNQLFAAHGLVADVFVDINNGMDRSGHRLDADLLPFYQLLQTLPNVRCHGLHVYDGHLRDASFTERQQRIDQGFVDVAHFLETLEATGLPRPMVIAGGTPTLTTHALRADTYCSPGTCVFWDWGYGDQLTEQPFDYAALLLTRVISKPKPGIVAIDLGHKGVAAENPIDKRVRFLNLTGYELLSQSEEHGVLTVDNWHAIQVGDLLYGVPYHICPTVNLYEEVYVADQHEVRETWQVTARKRRITV